MKIRLFVLLFLFGVFLGTPEGQAVVGQNDQLFVASQPIAHVTGKKKASHVSIGRGKGVAASSLASPKVRVSHPQHGEISLPANKKAVGERHPESKAKSRVGCSFGMSC